MPPDRGSTRKPAPPDKDGTKKTASVKSHTTRQEGTKSKRTADDKDKHREEQKATVGRTSKSRDPSSVRANDNRSQQKTSLGKGDEITVRKRESDKSHRISLDKRDSRSTTDMMKLKSSGDVNNDINKLKETVMKNRNVGKLTEKVSTPRRPSDGSSRELRTTTQSLSRKTTNSVKPSSTSSPRYDSKSQQKLATTTHRQIDQNRLHRNENIKSRSHVKESSSVIKKSLVTNITDPKGLSAPVSAEPVASQTKVSERRSRKSAEENVSHERSQPQKLSRDRTRTRTLSPREVKFVKNSDTFDKEKMKDEIEKFLNTPSTSSAAPLIPQVMVASKEESNTVNDDEYEYEDDFEDYESDFEECTDSDEDGASSTSDSSSSDIIAQDNDTKHPSQQQKPSVEEEKKMDSGNYDLAENQRKEKRIQELKLAVDRENATVSQKQNLSLQKSEQALEDEGFEEEKTEKMKNVSVKLKQSSINFESARKTRLQQQMLKRVRKRGEQLMKMIHFDVVSFSLLDLPPVPYDIYMRCYGKCNSVQAYVQTNEDNLSEEIQTEEITMKNKWTQYPVSFHTLKKGDDTKNEIQLFSQEGRGVGSDEAEENIDVWKSFIQIDTVRLSHFLQSAGKVVLVLLEESLLQKNETWKNKTQLPFSDGFVSLNVKSMDCLKNMPVALIQFPPGQATTLLTVHQGKDQVSNLCVWSLLEPSKPFMVLSCPGTVSATCFDSRAHVVLAGLSDGIICLWDLKEDSAYHITGMRSPTYNTANFLRKEGHFHPIVAIEPITHKVENTETILRSEVSPAQVCSLDISGLIVIWTVIQISQTGLLPARASQMDLGLAYWGRTRLVLSSIINIPCNMASLKFLKDAEYLSLGVDDKDHLYVGTTTGHIVHCLRSGMKTRPKMYLSSNDVCSHATCIDVCPYGEPFFLVGCSDGSMKLFWRNSERGIAQTPAGTSPLISIQWLYHSPCSVFSLDRTSRIQVWDLNVSDVTPVHSVCCEKTATSLRLSPRHINGREIPTVVLSFEDGTVEVHQLRKEFWSQSENHFREKINNFLRYSGVF